MMPEKQRWWKGCWCFISLRRQATNGNFIHYLDASVIGFHGPLAGYVKLQFAHAPGLLGTFPRHWLQRKTASFRPWRARAVMHVGIATPAHARTTCNFTYLARDTCGQISSRKEWSSRQRDINGPYLVLAYQCSYSVVKFTAHCDCHRDPFAHARSRTTRNLNSLSPVVVISKR